MDIVDVMDLMDEVDRSDLLCPLRPLSPLRPLCPFLCFVVAKKGVLAYSIFLLIACGRICAGVAQLVERHLPKVNVVSSNLITRFAIGDYFAGVAQW